VADGTTPPEVAVRGLRQAAGAGGWGAVLALQPERAGVADAGGWRMRPTIVCLCGSSRFSAAFRAANLRETLAGRIVLTIGCDFASDDALGLGPRDKARLDALHLKKLELCDEALVLNVGDYVGESTRNEVRYARQLGKPIRWLEFPSQHARDGELGAGCGLAAGEATCQPGAR
jgi:hypothetical protein